MGKRWLAAPALLGAYLACHALRLPVLNDLKLARRPPQCSGLPRARGTHQCSADRAPSTRRDFLKHIGMGLGGALAGMSVGNQPAYALLEDIKRKGRCPTYEDVKGSGIVDTFDVDKYMGIWYELAYHDFTQYKICGCTRFNMTRRGNVIEDMFTTKCPYGYDEADTFAINMTMAYNSATPGRFPEHAFYQDWPNMVVNLWGSADGGGGHTYQRSIQMQCVQLAKQRVFVGFNFLSRRPIIPPAKLEEMYDRAAELGLAPYGATREQMITVRHEGCTYPLSTDRSVIQGRSSRSWGSAVGVNILERSLVVVDGLS